MHGCSPRSRRPAPAISVFPRRQTCHATAQKLVALPRLFIFSFSFFSDFFSCSLFFLSESQFNSDQSCLLSPNLLPAKRGRFFYCGIVILDHRPGNERGSFMNPK